MRKEFWDKLKSNQRNFKWFFDNYLTGENAIDLTYNSLYKQAQGIYIDSITPKLQKAMDKYLGE